MSGDPEPINTEHTDFAHHMRAPCVGGASCVSTGGRQNKGLGIKSPDPALAPLAV